MSAGAGNKRRAQAEETRTRLFAIACRLFAERGYHATHVAEIAAAAGVAKGTFFIHFGTKDAVITELLRRQVETARRAGAAARRRGTPVDALVTTVMTLGAEAGRSHELTRAVLAATLENQELGSASEALFTDVLDEMTADARGAAERGLLHRRRDPELLAHALLDSYLGAALHFATVASPRPLVELLAPLVESSLAAHVKEDRHGKNGATASPAALPSSAPSAAPAARAAPVARRARARAPRVQR